MDLAPPTEKYCGLQAVTVLSIQSTILILQSLEAVCNGFYFVGFITLISFQPSFVLDIIYGLSKWAWPTFTKYLHKRNLCFSYQVFLEKTR